MPSTLDAVVVGAGPNGLAAAITLARAGQRVTLLEANATVGGAVHSAALTLPGFVHDPCAAIFPLAAGSPFFRSLPLGDHGLSWVQPDIPLAHPLDGGRAVLLEASLDATAAGLGDDGRRYARLVAPLVARWQALLAAVDQQKSKATDAGDPLAQFPLLRTLHPGFALFASLFAALRSADALALTRFRSAGARALLSGIAAHAMQPLDQAATAGFALTLGAAAHAVGWPLARGGSQRLADALASLLRSLGGSIVTDRRVDALDDLPPSRAILLDVSAPQLGRLGAGRLPPRTLRALARFRRGPGVFKIDYVLDTPIPWVAEGCRRAGVVHVGGTHDEIAAACAAVGRGDAAPQPFVLVAQPSLFDRTRVPAGHDGHTVWAYCHVPNGSTVDMTDAIEAQIERFAPGFHARILARHVMGPATLAAGNANLDGGDIGGGACDLRQLIARPLARLIPWATPDPRLYLCSSSTPPGPGAHGLCGYLAARAALRRLRR